MRSPRRVLYIISVTILFLVLGAAFVPIARDTAAGLILKSIISRYETKYGCTFEFGRVKMRGFDMIQLDGVRVLVKEETAFYSNTLFAKINSRGVLSRGIKAGLLLKDVRFYRKGALSNKLSEILSIESVPIANFDVISCGLEVKGGSNIVLSDIQAISQRVRIFADATIDGSFGVASTAKVLLSRDITSQIPDMVRGAILKREDDDWMSIALEVKGSLASPSVTIASRLIKLEIKEVK